MAYHIEDCQTDSARNWIAAEGIEVLHPVRKRRCDCRCRDDGSQRMTVSDWFAECHNVRHDVLRLEHPKVRARTAKASLHLIGNANSASVSDCGVSSIQITRRKNDLAATTQCRFAEERSKTLTSISDLSRCLNHIVRIKPGRIRSAMCASVDIRHHYLMNPGRTAFAAWAIELVRAEIDHRAGVAVISRVDDDHCIPTGVRSGQTQRQFVRFAAAVNQVHHAQRFRQGRCQPLGVLNQVFMKITSIRIENRHLFCGGAYYQRMAVSHMRHVINAIQIVSTASIIKILTRATDDMQRRLVGNAERWTKMTLACCQQFNGRSLLARILPLHNRQPAGITKDPSGPIERNV